MWLPAIVIAAPLSIAIGAGDAFIAGYFAVVGSSYDCI